MIDPIITKSQEMVDEYLREIEDLFNADVFCIYGPIAPQLVDLARDSFENKKNKGKQLKDKLCVILTTNGGDANSTERIVNILRHHYKEVEFIVPDHAYSAGTILCMSGDRIWMNYNSVLGPIDPQVLNKDGKYVPALGYLEKIEMLLDKAQKGTLTQAEFLILKDQDLAEISMYEQARDLTKDLLKQWLVKYKFKNWHKHKSNGAKVTKDEKNKRAEEIATNLGDYKKWKSHGRPLNLQTINDIKLIVDDFGANEEQNTAIMNFHSLFINYMKLLNINNIVYMRGE